jgi:1,2-diacylglycerol 3-beta-galactosyltransferase
LRPPSILILFSDTGGGHRAAAGALEGALRQLQPGVRLALNDPLIGQGPPLIRRLASLYSPIIQRARPAWGVIYHGSNTPPTFAALRAVFGHPVREVIHEAIHLHDPDIVVSVHPLLNHMAAQAIRHSYRHRALVTVVTDLVEFHRGWSCPRADLVVVPTERARQVCLRRRVPAERILLLGLPVDLRFRPPAPGEKAALRRMLGLDEDRLTILVAGGAEGSGRLLRQVRGLSWSAEPWQVVAVCGRNEKLRRRLARLHFPTPTLVLGFVDNMPELMRAADVIVSKAGPGAIAEALATGLPMVLTSYLPGQETENVGFVKEYGLGVYAARPEQVLEAIREQAAEGGRLHARMSANAASISRPYAALDIARECLRLAAEARATGTALAG